MFDTFDNKDTEKGSCDERNHQDNFYSEGSYNNNFQYCTYCRKYERFEYDRCSKCKNN